jgi:hypothetical protein
MEILYCSSGMIYNFLNPLWENHAIWLAMVLFKFIRGVFKSFFSEGLFFPKFDKTR